ncbi:MAG: transposase [Oligoflexales bacterium]|nr:transposase [Oligoflexales bacterium]
MKNDIAYIGIDIDDKAYHVSGVNEQATEITSFVVKGSVNKLTKELMKRFSNFQLNVCYEASYTGYSQARILKKRGVDCAVIAPTSIPKSPNERVKNDRIDALRLAQLWAKGSLSVVAIPSEEQEADRALVRAREFIVSQIGDMKRKIISLCREFGINYKDSAGGAAQYWTKSHRNWLDQTIKELGPSYQELTFILTTLIAQLESKLALLDLYEQRISQVR